MMGTKDRYSRLELLIYGVSWTIVFLIPVSIELYDNLSGEISSFEIGRVMNAELTLVEFFVLFLLNNFVLLPQLFFKKRKLWYALALIVCFVALWYIQVPPEPRHIPAHPMPEHRPPFGMFHVTNLVIELCVVFANFAIKIYVQSLRREVLMLNIRNEKIKSELDSLKYQISPHFLMNTLNNIQSLIESDPSRAYYTIQGLSRMMRYLLYENNSQYVSLQKEVDFMSDFIEMMKIRYPDSVQVSAQFPVECSDVYIPPLLFLSFLENAFKYGVSFVDESFITVNLSIEHDHLIFKCANSKNVRDKKKDGAKGGLGIENVKRRLQLIYGDRYELTITDTEKLYIVEIDLPLEERGLPNHD